MRVRPLSLALGCAVLTAAFAPGAELASIQKPAFRALAVRVFTLDRAQEVRIEGVTFSSQSAWVPARIWLLDAQTRKVVWDAADAELESRRRDLAPFDERVSLPAGDYELYLATFPGTAGGWDRHGVDVRELMGKLREAIDVDGLEDLVGDLEVRVSGEGTPVGDGLKGAVRERLAGGAAAALLGLGDEADAQAGFALREPADVRVVCVGEVSGDEVYDGGFIENADTGETVWRFDPDAARTAGGAAKNRVVDEIIHLPAGRFVAHFASDDSHAYPEFNALPPDDPLAWGLVVRTVKPAAGLVEQFVAAEVTPRNVLAALTAVGNDEHRSSGFTLRRPMAVRVTAVGEGFESEMADHGWIVDAGTHTTVWEMDYGRSEHAGGAEKNRLVEEVVKLPAGSYVAHFSTDGSHAFGDWNAAPPFERRRWGITVAAADAAFAPTDVAPYDPEQLEDALARVARVRDHQRRDATFTLERDADVEIYALGESDGREMADYGWIEEAGGGRRVWEMTHADTEHAGGAKKNRMFRGRVHLPAGIVPRRLQDRRLARLRRLELRSASRSRRLGHHGDARRAVAGRGGTPPLSAPQRAQCVNGRTAARKARRRSSPGMLSSRVEMRPASDAAPLNACLTRIRARGPICLASSDSTVITSDSVMTKACAGAERAGVAWARWDPVGGFAGTAGVLVPLLQARHFSQKASRSCPGASWRASSAHSASRAGAVLAVLRTITLAIGPIDAARFSSIRASMA